MCLPNGGDLRTQANVISEERVGQGGEIIAVIGSVRNRKRVLISRNVVTLGGAESFVNGLLRGVVRVGRSARHQPCFGRRRRHHNFRTVRLRP